MKSQSEKIDIYLRIQNKILFRFQQHSVSSSLISKSNMKSSTFFNLLWAFTARECLAGIIIRTKNLDETSIFGAAVSNLLFNFDNFMYRIFYHS